MRNFKCYDCNHTWSLPFGTGGRGTDQVCPKCGSQNIHRVGKERRGTDGNRGFYGRRRGAFQGQNQQETTK